MKLNFFRWNSTKAAQSQPPLTLLFLHGLGGTGQIWRSITASLENTFDCLAPDQRGHGGSRPLPTSEENSLNALDFAQDVKELLDQLQISKCIVIGHSMGVRTSLALTTLIPEKISGVMALDLGLSQQWGGGMGIALSQFIENLPESFASREAMKEYLNKNCPDPSIAQYLGAVAKEDATKVWRFPFDHSAMVKTIELAHQAPLKEWLLKAAQHSIPFLFLQGKNSRVWSLADYEKQKAELSGPIIQFESWENAGHGLPFEKRPQFVERLKIFAEQVTRKQS